MEKEKLSKLWEVIRFSLPRKMQRKINSDSKILKVSWKRWKINSILIGLCCSAKTGLIYFKNLFLF